MARALTFFVDSLASGTRNELKELQVSGAPNRY
jgi:hypothetical protein